MARQTWVALTLSLVLILALAACGGSEPEPDRPAASEATATATPAGVGETAPDTSAATEPSPTEEAAPENDEAALDLTVYTPGLHARSGLTIVRSTEWAEGEAGAFFAEVRNDTGQLLRLVEGSIDLLDADHLHLGTIPLNVLLNDIPPGRSFFVGETFALPSGYADAAIWLDYRLAEAPSLDAYYDLPVTIETQGPNKAIPFLVRGTIENTSGRDLVFWAVTLAALDADNQIIGLAYAVVAPGTPDRVWTAGATVPFEAPFAALAGDASTIVSVTASAVGYAPLD